MTLKKISLDLPLPLFYKGSDLELEPHLPTVLYLGLSARESLEVDPYNQPTLTLLEKGFRVLSVDLPFHGKDLQAIKAMQRWAEIFASGQDFITPFLENLEKSLRAFFSRFPSPWFGAMGLSRGGFVAAHLAARLPLCKALAGFAPLTRLTSIKEFKDLSCPQAEALALSSLQDSLYSMPLKAFIGNHDTRVGTDLCFSWISSLAAEAYKRGIRSPPQELCITPSIGAAGHGTSKESFTAGALFLAAQMRGALS